MHTFLDTVRSTIAKHRMLRPRDCVLVGVSGGPDSLALLSALVALRGTYRLTLRAAYVDHGLRPAAARQRESRLVKKIGRALGVAVNIVVRRVKRRKAESLEAAAREVRYAVLGEIARRYRCQAIALGHTADDQAETVLMWILRGAGTTGLTGIPPVRKIRVGTGSPLRIIRPLIRCPRREIEEYLKAQGIRPLLDRSNLSHRFLRNRIRRDLLSTLEREYNTQVRKHLCDLADILREDLDWLRDEARRQFRQVATIGKAKIRLDRSRLRKLHPALRRAILRLAAERLQGNGQGFALRHWELLDRLLIEKDRGALDLPHGFRAKGDPLRLTLSMRG